MDTLLIRYLGGEATAGETVQAEQWIKNSAENSAYFKAYAAIWKESRDLMRKSNLDEHAAWQRFDMLLQNSEITQPAKNYRLKWLKAAAIFLLVCGAVLFSTRLLKHEVKAPLALATADTTKNTMLVTASANYVKMDTLPDSSVVILNKYSSLAYIRAFEGPSRYIELSGEAFFQVKHNAGKPFIVKADDILIAVLGTSFNIKINGDTTEIIVASGTVRVQKKLTAIVLHADEKASVLEGDTVLTKSLNRSRRYRRYFDSSVVTVKPPAHAREGVVAKSDSAFDINKHPSLMDSLMKDPNKWASLLKNYIPQNQDISYRRSVVNQVLDEIAKEKIMTRSSVRSFRLNEDEFIINDITQPGTIQQQFKNKFIKEQGYNIYLGGSSQTGKGVFLSRDSL